MNYSTFILANIHNCIIQLIISRINTLKIFYVVLLLTTALEAIVDTEANPCAVVGATI
jgi:hypothetical protein